MLDMFLQYYGFDWLSLLFGLSGTYLLGNSSKTGFVLGGISVVMALGVSLMIGSVPFMISNLLSLALFARGFYKWHKPTAPREINT